MSTSYVLSNLVECSVIENLKSKCIFRFSKKIGNSLFIKYFFFFANLIILNSYFHLHNNFIVFWGKINDNHELR